MSFKRRCVYVYVCNRPVVCLCVKDVSGVDSWWTPAWRRCDSELIQCHSYSDLTWSLPPSRSRASVPPSATAFSLSRSIPHPLAISLSLTMFVPSLAFLKPFTQDQVAGVGGGGGGGGREKTRESQRALYQQVCSMGLSAVSQEGSPWWQEVSLPCIAAFCATSCSLEHAFHRSDWSCAHNMCVCVCVCAECVRDATAFLYILCRWSEALL